MKKYLINNYSLFIVPFIAAISLAIYLIFNLQFAYDDAISRSFHAYAVFFGNEPKFASIGFVWPPFPTLFALPFVLIPPLNLYGIVGNITSALFLGISSLYLNAIFKFFKLSWKKRLVLLLLFIFNPMILFYGANGMSEMMAISFLVAAVYYLLSYLKNDNILYLIGTSAATGLAIMTRYEMLALIPAIILSLIFFRTNNLQIINRETIKTLEGNLVLFSVPIAFVIGIWIFANWTIMHDPLYFANSVYSNTSQSAQLHSDSSYYRGLRHNIWQSLVYVSQRIFVLYPAFIFFTLLVLAERFQRHNWNFALAVIFLPLSLIFFHTFLLYQGQSFGWLRFFIYIIPASFILSALLLQWCKKRIYYNIFVSLVISLHFISSLWTFYAMSAPNYGKEEHAVITAVKTQDSSGLDASSYTEDLAIANYLNENITDGKVLVDDFTGFPVVYFSRNTNLFVETIDSNFQDRLKNLKNDAEIKYILAHEKVGAGNLDAINIMYPSMFDDGAGMAVLVKDFGIWRLYKKN